MACLFSSHPLPNAIIMATTRTFKQPRDQQGEHKGQVKQDQQKGAAAVSKHDAGKHKKDNSDGAEENTTKKQQNAI